MECDAKYISGYNYFDVGNFDILVKRWSPEHEAWASQVTEKKWKIRKEVGELWMDTDESDVFLFRVCLFKVDFHCHVSFTGVRK